MYGQGRAGLVPMALLLVLGHGSIVALVTVDAWNIHRPHYRHHHGTVPLTSDGTGTLGGTEWIIQSPLQSAARMATSLSSLSSNNNNNDEPDLFDYFDPLLSPHCYPKGISPNVKPVPQKTASSTSIQSRDPLQLNLYDAALSGSMPLSSSSSFTSTNTTTSQSTTSATMTTPTTVSSSIGFFGVPSLLSDTTTNDHHPAIDPTITFDPTLSPHLYRTGRVPSRIVGDDDDDHDHNDGTISARQQSQSQSQSRSLQLQPPPAAPPASLLPKRIGILLMDHGSRNDASNVRLHELARLYQETTMLSSSISSSSSSLPPSSTSTLIVQAAHMELAHPTIIEGMQLLQQAGVDEIICHPYFLSPLGRHVQDDIPRLVNQAIYDLQINIPVTTTEPVGANLKIMIGAIHTMVQQSSVYMTKGGHPSTKEDAPTRAYSSSPSNNYPPPF